MPESQVEPKSPSLGKQALRDSADKYDALFRLALQRGCFHEPAEVAKALQDGASMYRAWDEYKEPKCAEKSPCGCDETKKA